MDFRRKSEEVNALYREFSEEDAAQLKNDYAAVLQMPAFRRIFVAILRKSHVFGSISYDTVDPNIVMKAVGFRELGVDIYMSANQADSAMVLKAIAERNELDRERRIRIENATKGNEK